jgi:UDP-N-acetylglucosamine 2-epimerase (non-hydrolysing)
MNNIISLLEKTQEKIKIIFPMHPRTKLNIKKFGFGSRMKSMENLIQLEPVGYLDFMSLMSNSKFVITDSGGIQEETSILGIPCITLRDNTERPVTVEQGTNIIVSTDQSKIMGGITNILQGRIDLKGAIPEKWDGRAAERIVKVLMDSEN